MIKPQRLIDIFASAVVAVGILMGGAGLYTRHIAPTEDAKRLAETCWPAATQETVCTVAETHLAKATADSRERGRKLALGGLFVLFAGGMIGGTASYARMAQSRMAHPRTDNRPPKP